MPINTGINRILDFELIARRNIANGYAGLDGFGLIAASQIPDLFVKIAGDQMTGDLEIINTYGLRVKDGAQFGYFNQTAGNTFLYGSGAIKFYDVGIPAGITLSDLNKFIKKSDVPATYTGQGSKYVCVNAGETALEFVAAGGIPGGPYLPLIGGTLTGNLIINKAVPILYLNSGGVEKAHFYWDTNTYLDGAAGNIFIATTSGVGNSIKLQTNIITRLTIEDALITAATDIDINKAVGVPTITLKTAGTTVGAVLYHAVEGMRFYSQSIALEVRTSGAGIPILLQTNSTTRLTIADAGITFGAGVISNVTMAKSNPLLSIKATDASSPVLDFRDSANNVEAQLYSSVANDTVLVANTGGLYLATKAVTGGTIYLEPKDVTKLAINDTDILGYSPITLQNDSAAIYFKNTLGTAKGALIPYDATLDLTAAATQDLRLDTGAAGKSVIARTNGTTRLTIADAKITSTVDHYINSGTASGLILQRSGADSFIFTVNAAGNGFIRNWDGTVSIGAKDSTTDITIGYAGQNVILQNNGTTKLTIGAGITAAAAIAMGANKITGLAAATANGDAVRFEQINNTYSMEVCDNNVGISPLDATTYYFGHIGIAATTTANQQAHLRMIPKTGIITAAMFMMYATTAGTNENITVNIRLNNTGDTGVATVGVSALVRSFSNTGLNIAVTAGDNIEIKILYPTWATNPLVVTWDGTLIITTPT